MLNKSLGLLAAVIATVAAVSVGVAQEDQRLVWGGGDPKVSVYSDVYVPRVIEVLAENALNGYKWAGVSAGTIENVERVTANPTHLAVGQLDLLRDAQTNPNYKFTILAENIGPECLYMVTTLKGYNTFGDVLANAWDMTIITGSEKSGSYGTLKRLQALPGLEALNDAIIQTTDSTAKIIEAVGSDNSITHGFFVMRPDPKSDIFKAIADRKLTLIPVIDFALEDDYTFQELKIAHGGLFSGDTWHTTACTSVALFTGDPSAVDPNDTRTVKRLQATIDRIRAVPPDNLKPNLSSWRDMWDSMKALAGDKAKELMEASRRALEDAVENINDSLPTR